MRLLDGSKTATERRKRLAERIEPGLHLGIIVATDDGATLSYIEAKRSAAAEIGMQSSVTDLGPEASRQTILEACRAYNADPALSGYIVQLPLPAGIDRLDILAAVAPAKDADGLTPTNLGYLAAGHPRIVPATPKGVISLLDTYGVPTRGRHAVIIGKGLLTGLPLSMMLAQRGATVTVCDSDTPDISVHTRQADILVTATGVAGLITADMVRPGSTVIDIGTSVRDGRIVGDVRFGEAKKVAGAITPVPGGVGPMTVVSLLENVHELSKLAQNTH